MSAEKWEAEAVEIITRDMFKLPAGCQSGTAKLLVRLIVDAAVARMAERKTLEQQAVGVLAGNDNPANLAANHKPEMHPQRQPLGLPRKDRK